MLYRGCNKEHLGPKGGVNSTPFWTVSHINCSLVKKAMKLYICSGLRDEDLLQDTLKLCIYAEHFS